MESVDERIFNIMSVVFKKKRSDLTEYAAIDTLDSWDSMNHMNLILALEEEFKISFTDDDIAQLVSFKLVRHRVESLIKDVS
jgi:acyl carrier protein